MVSFFQTLLDRFKNLFVTNAALDLQAEMASHAANRQAELLRRARSYEVEGLTGIAHFLRKQAEQLETPRPLEEVLVTGAFLGETMETPRGAIRANGSERNQPKAMLGSARKQKGG